MAGENRRREPEGYLTDTAPFAIIAQEADSPTVSIGQPGGVLSSPPGCQTDERGLELLAYASRVEEARLLVIVRHGRVVRWRALPHRRMAHP
jgi:hypothetical protein